VKVGKKRGRMTAFQLSLIVFLFIYLPSQEGRGEKENSFLKELKEALLSHFILNHFFI